MYRNFAVVIIMSDMRRRNWHIVQLKFFLSILSTGYPYPLGTGIIFLILAHSVYKM